MANLDKSKNHSIFGRPFSRLGLVRVSQALHSTLRKRCSSFRRFTAGVLATLALATADTAFAFNALSKPQLPPKPSTAKSGSGTAAPAPSAQRSQPSASSDKTVTVTGIVRDEAGKPMSGVGVIVKGMLTGTVTGTDGSYALKARPNDELSFSFLGYKTPGGLRGQQIDHRHHTRGRGAGHRRGRRHGFGPQTRREIARLRRLQGRR